MIDPLVLLEIKGEQLVACLENGVSMYPKLEGRFPQVSDFFKNVKDQSFRYTEDTIKIYLVAL